jgi:hypothetical protein
MHKKSFSVEDLQRSAIPRAERSQFIDLNGKKMPLFGLIWPHQQRGAPSCSRVSQLPTSLSTTGVEQWKLSL